MRIAATADLHFTPARFQLLHDQMNRVREEADIFVLAGDLTNYGRPEEMEPLLNVLVRLRLPIVAVLGNHDYESGVLTAFGEPEIKTFVRASIEEALKLERAMSQLRTPKRVIVLHYSPIV